jgi:putative Mg2+ transporter-C (MgtC) family protein
VNDLAIDPDAIARLVAGVVLGAAVGIEREAADQPAGLRTHIAVAAGACLFGVISTMGFTEFDRPRAESTLQADVTRVASQVVVGIGFLGAGMIFRQGTAVRNLTTAASLWAVAAIGLAAGVGSIGLAALATVVLLVSLALLRPLRSLLHRRGGMPSHSVTLHVSHDAARPFLDELGADDHVGLQAVGRDEGGTSVRIELVLSARPEGLVAWVAQMVDRPEVVAVDADLS